MKISSKGLTAIKLFIDLGEQSDEGFVSLIDVSKRKEVSKKFLEQIVVLYKNEGLLIGNRGNQGGYKLAKPANQISLKDILYVSENFIAPLNYNASHIDEIFQKLDTLLDDYLSSVTLDKLIEKQRESYSNSYVI